ncbi:MAG TPA: hypothetical protein VK467_06965 [Gemmatimonadales bacterium]|nr:hypothetical protein [Gemmatimonadales bacterium]
MADRYLLESSPIDGVQLEDGSGVVLLESGGDPYFTNAPRVVLPAPRVIVSVLALVPLVAAAADAAPTVSAGQLYRGPTAQYAPLAGPMVAGQPLAWEPLNEFAVRARLTLTQSILAAPVQDQPAAPVTLGWLPKLPDYAKPYLRLESVLVSPPSQTASASQNITWWPETLDPAPRVPLIRSVAAHALTVTPPPPAADGSSDNTGAAQIQSRGTVHYLAIAGPVFVPSGVTPDFSWTPRIPEIVRGPVTGRSELASPSSVTASASQNITWWPNYPDRLVLPRRDVSDVMALVVVPSAPVVPDGPLRFNGDGLVQPDRYTHFQAVAGPVAIPLEVGWWPAPPRIVLARPFLAGTVIAKAPLPLDGAARSDLPWLPDFPALYRARRAFVSVYASPLREPDASPAPQIPWIVQPRLVIRPFARVESVYSKPTVPVDPDGRSDLPWLPEFRPLFRALRLIPSQLAAPLREPDASVAGDLPWLPTFRVFPRQVLPLGSVHAEPVRPPDPVIWWMPRPRDLVAQRYRTDAVLVVPSIAIGSAQQGVTWWPKFPDRLVLRIRQEPSIRTEPPTLFTLLAPAWVIRVPEWPQTILVVETPQIILVPEWPDDMEIP